MEDEGPHLLVGLEAGEGLKRNSSVSKKPGSHWRKQRAGLQLPGELDKDEMMVAMMWRMKGLTSW